MKVLRLLAVLTFVLGASSMMYALIFTGGDPPKPTFFDATPFPDDTPTPAPTDVEAPAATPTPSPFDGPVARMKIPRLGIDYATTDLGVLPDGHLDTPHGGDSITKIGFYKLDGYAKPGWGGNAFFSAHVNFDHKDGPFAKLIQAVAGDEIVVEMANGPTYRYRIFRKQRYDVNKIDMGAIVWPPEKPEGKEWITLMTCSCEPGRIIFFPNSDLGECLDRDVVVAERIS